MDRSYVIYKELGAGGLPGCLDYLPGTDEAVKDECETKRWKKQSGGSSNYRDRQRHSEAVIAHNN